jgi:hypothetical protein
VEAAEISGKVGKDGIGLEGFVQQRVEQALTSRLASVSDLWAKRPDLRVKVLIDLYLLRNAVFGIKATTVRKMIPLRYARNMQALETILSDADINGIPVLVYIAPLRPDVAAPYDPLQYSEWKDEVFRLAKRHHARLMNLETLVPAKEWGTYSGDEVDFMHFKGPGHAMVADALRPAVTELLGIK